jgi:hypothetical protein
MKGRNIIISIAAFFIPFISGYLVGNYFGQDVMSTIFIGLCVAITALPVSIRILMDLGKLNSPVGQKIISVAIFDDVIALRNSYAHGATPSDEKCAEDIQKFEPFLMQLLALNWLHQSYLEVEDNKVILNYKQQKLSLHPLLLYRNEQTQASFAFFNDLKNDKIGLLNYPLGKHYREKEFLNEFHQYLPLHDWKKTGANEFQQRIEELTETFKGRTAERKQLLNFVLEKQKGYCSIQGNPGIGKSAIIAQFFKDLRLHESCKDIQVIEYFIRRGTQQAKPEVLLEYLIKKTDELFPKAREIRAEGKMISDLQNQLFAKWRLRAEHCNGTKLLFLIDGLDEGVEENIIQYLPKENFQNMLFIYGSRPGGHKSIEELWGNLPIEHHLKIELSGLGKEDIRAMIYEVANKYEIEKDSAWIEAIQQRSQGNPLYLKLLCDAIANKSIGLNDINALPKEIDEYYKAILFRYAQDSVDGDALLDSLCTFAAAKDYLSFAHIGLINKLGEAKLQRIGSTLKEVLIENPLTEDVLDYQLFHESFREYLFKVKSFKITEANEQIINYCGSWKKLEGTWEQRYALEFYTVHLSESKKTINHETLLKLIEDKAFLHTQKEVLRHFKASNKLMQMAIEKSAELKNQDTLLEAALCLVDLKYEEDNDAPRILEMIANGEIDFALQRIEAFATNDKEGLKRKFILYMLCLMELTLLESKDKPFRKEAIEKLLKHLDENIPIDHSVLNWNDFFSSYLIFQMACEWSEIGVNFMIISKRTDDLQTDIILESRFITETQSEVLMEFTQGISDKSNMSNALQGFSIALIMLGRIEDAISFAQDINIDWIKDKVLQGICSELAKQGKIDEALECVQDKFDAESSYKSKALQSICNELAKQGKIEEALACAPEDETKSISLAYISTQLYSQGEFRTAASVLQESFECVQDISGVYQKGKTLQIISLELAKQEKIEEALECASRLSNSFKFKALGGISSELAIQGKFTAASSIIQEVLIEIQKMDSFMNKNHALTDITKELAKQGKIELAIKHSQDIGYIGLKAKVLRNISTELAKLNKNEESFTVMLESLNSARGIKSDVGMSNAYIKISHELANQGKVQLALVCAKEIVDKRDQNIALSNIALELIKHGKIEEALECTKGMSAKLYKCNTLVRLSTELTRLGKFTMADNVMQEALTIAQGLNIDRVKNEALKSICSELAKQGKIDEAFECVRNIIEKEPYYKIKALQSISIELAIKDKIDEALACAREITEDKEKSISLAYISTQLYSQGEFRAAASVLQESFECIYYIKEEWEKNDALASISLELTKQEKVNEAIEWYLKITNENHKNDSLKSISAELFNQNNFKLAEKTGLKISKIDTRQECWKSIAKNAKEQLGWKKALEQLSKLQNKEMYVYYLKGLAENINVNDANKECLFQFLPLIMNETNSIETVLQAYALNEIFFKQPSKELVNRLNQSLNLQWALDITSKFEKEFTRSSQNIQEWINEIEDENDREDVLSWSEKVAQGKMTEDKFLERINKL